jgi:hypothetical protein
MSSSIDISKLNLDSEIPTGPWTMYFHSPEETKWTLNTFINLGSMKSWRDFWSVIETLKADSLSDGMFFLMRDPIPPLWENHQNIRGGSYSIRVQKRDAGEVYITYAISAMLANMCKESTNQINGISISPKKGFNIIKIWNIDAVKYKLPTDIHLLCKEIKQDDVIYTPFVQKKM